MIVFCPKSGAYPQLVSLVDQDHEVVAEDFRQRLVDLGGGRLAAERVAKRVLVMAYGEGQEGRRAGVGDGPVARGAVPLRARMATAQA